jgi:hypothetical protein
MLRWEVMPEAFRLAITGRTFAANASASRLLAPAPALLASASFVGFLRRAPAAFLAWSAAFVLAEIRARSFSASV